MQVSETVFRTTTTTETRTGTREVTFDDPPRTETVTFEYTVTVVVTGAEIVVHTEVVVTDPPGLDPALAEVIAGEIEAEMSAAILLQIETTHGDVAARAIAADPAARDELLRFASGAGARAAAAQLAGAGPLMPDGAIDAGIVDPFLDEFSVRPAPNEAFALRFSGDDFVSESVEAEQMAELDALRGLNAVRLEMCRSHPDSAAFFEAAYVREADALRAENPDWTEAQIISAAGERAQSWVERVNTPPDWMPGFEAWASQQTTARDYAAGIERYMSYRDELVLACWYNGQDPERWLDNKAFFEVAMYESWWNPLATNAAANSSATGVGQLTDTWAWDPNMSVEQEAGLVPEFVEDAVPGWTPATDVNPDVPWWSAAGYDATTWSESEAVFWQILGYQRYVIRHYVTPEAALEARTAPGTDGY